MIKIVYRKLINFNMENLKAILLKSETKEGFEMFAYQYKYNV